MIDSTIEPGFQMPSIFQKNQILVPILALAYALSGCTGQPAQTFTPTETIPPKLIETFTPTVTVEISSPTPAATPTRTMPLIPMEKELPAGLILMERCISKNAPCHDQLHFSDQNGVEHKPEINGVYPVLSHNRKMATFESYGDLWLIHLDTGFTKILTNTEHIDESSVTWSPDDTRIAYLAETEDQLSDVFLLDLQSGETKNISNTPDRYETCISPSDHSSNDCALGWWPQQPNLIFLSSGRADTEFGGPPFRGQCHAATGECTMFPTAISTDGSTYQVLDDLNGMYSLPSLSPDGRVLAYDGGMLYDLKEKSKEIIDPSDYGLDILPSENTDSNQMISPIWSPNGKYLAWVAHINMESETGIFILEPGTKNGRLLLSYQPYYDFLTLAPWQRWDYPIVQWSPDGNWLSVVSETWNKFSTEFDGQSGNDRRILWLVKMDGSIQKRIGLGDYGDEPLAWSPDSSRIIFNSHYYGPTVYPSPTYILNISDWSETQLPIPDYTYPIAWDGLQ